MKPLTPNSGSLRFRRQRQGAILFLVAFILVAFFIVGAIAINLCYIDLCNAELRTATDAAARAAARTYAQTGNQEEAINAGISAGAQNQVATQGLQLSSSDFSFGNSSRNSIDSRYSFVAGANPLNAVHVEGRRTDTSLGGNISLFFGELIGTTSYQPSASAVATQAELDILFVLDFSGSMAFEAHEDGSQYIPPAADLNANGFWDPGEWNFGDPPPIPGNSRWSGVCAAMQIFMNELQTTKPIERISVVKFNHEAFVAIDFTSSYANVMSQINQVSPTGATAIGTGIELGANQFLTSPNHRSWASKVMIVLTDGQSNYGIDPIVAASVAANQGITLHTVSFTSFGSAAVMEQIAEIGGGVFKSAANNTELKDAFQEIVASMPILLIE